MRVKKLSKLFKEKSDRIATVAIIILWGLFEILGLFQKFDYRLYDLLLGLRPQPETRPELLFVEIDNKSLEDLGPWPWSRDILANSLIRMKELGAKTAVFDIEYLSPSNLGVNPNATEDISKAIDVQKQDVADVINQLAGAATGGMYSKTDLTALAKEAIEEWVNPGLDALKDSIRNASFQDNDALFAKSIQFFGDTWLTVNILDLDINYTQEYLDYVKQKCLYSNVEDKTGRIKKGNLYYLIDQGGDNKLGFCPARQQFMQGAAGAGFTNVVLDSDGTRRRVELLSDQDGSYVAQLVFSPILKILNPKKIIRTPFAVKLVDAKDPDTGELTDISIPVDRHGRMLINWLKKEFIDSFRRESVVMLFQLDETENNILALLGTLSNFNLWDKNGNSLSFKNEVNEILQDYSQISEYKNYLLSKCKGTDEKGKAIDGGIAESEYSDYFSARAAFFERVSSFISGSYFPEIFERLKEMSGELDEQNYKEVVSEIENLYDSLKNESEIYLGTFAEKKEAYKDSFCIIGNTASSTTDLGTTPFNRAYPNVGTHANVYNTIINRNFVREIHWIFAFVFASLLAFFCVVYTTGKKALAQNFFGILSVLLTIAIPQILMVVFKIYVPITASVLITTSTYLVAVILRFVTAEKDKSVLRNAFSTYLAPAVVEQIVKDPSKLKLGGVEKRMTALFSDIKAFSSFSELVTPTELVSILNEYLGSMSDMVLAEQGTIDKYIGDSIVAFFGAPIDLEQPAWSAIVSAIRMKQQEDKFNSEKLASGSIPMELKTRIGINTGNMVVGNMGTSTKMNYTIMGDAVNLASRLEGVNKVYKSWILCSDYTWDDANSGEHLGKIAARRFDRVRVVGREEPVQLWNILGFKDELAENVLESIDVFDKAMEKYLSKDFAGAGKLFLKANKLVPEDESPLVYAQRCKDYIEKGLPEHWDGIMNMTSK
ncbi:CHASE2 domain-containing protein [Treponema pectinovorum]|uniref:CHASE2 domain-containing protein n=1 Tax=Treponema pectinovorum TaxID=164 RepID=UPI00165A07C3|nr:CHASE2 domain-containing protein [Treponema pectinovorum]